MDSNDYLEDGVTRVIKLMKDTFGDDFRTYLNGVPENVPEMMLPCLAVGTNRGSIKLVNAATDTIEESVSIYIILNKKTYLSPDQSTDYAERAIRRIVMGQDNITPEGIRPYMTKSIMAALRSHISLFGVDLSHEVEFEFGVGGQIDANGNPFATQEASVTISIQRLALLPSGRD